MSLPIEKREGIRESYYKTCKDSGFYDEKQDAAIADYFLAILDQEVSYAVERTKREIKDNVLGMIVKNCRMFEHVGAFQIAHLNMYRFEKDLEEYLSEVTKENE